MSVTQLILLATGILEVILLLGVVLFFIRLRRSESALYQIQARQREFLEKLRVNAELEKELMDSFTARQKELTELNASLEGRVTELRKLLKQADSVGRSPNFMRQMVLNGHRQGQNSRALAKASGLSLDEVEFIISQAE